jgi:YHS domain-containing protein
MHHSAGGSVGWRQRLTSVSAWSDVAHNFRGDWQMLWKEIGIGLLLSGFVAQLSTNVWKTLFLTGAPGAVRALWGAVVGPLIAVATFVCSVGNVPLAAVLWTGGISFAGVIAFIFADLLILPIVSIYRKYYGTPFTLRLVGVMVVAIVVAAIVVQALFGALDWVPAGRPLRSNVFASVHVDYKLVLNVIGLLLSAGLWLLTLRRGAVDPVCGMAVDRGKALTAEHEGRRMYFCCDGCRASFQADPQRYLGSRRAQDPPAAGKPPEGTSRHTTIKL